MPPTSIMIIAGEASGDMHGARLARSLRQENRDLFLFGVGGSFMEAEGVRTIVDAHEIAVVGITEVISRLPTIYRAMATVKKALQSMRPDLLILIDFPEFNFRVATLAKKLNIPVLYYISPQIWAWRQNRVKKIKQLVDHMAVILPFEADFYEAHQVPVTFVGHPLLDRIPLAVTSESSHNQKDLVIGLLPGSRQKEVATLLPVLLQAAKQIHGQLPGTRFLVSHSPSIQARQIEDLVGLYGGELPVTIESGAVDQVFSQSRLLIAASGTVTLEAALHLIPTILIYKVSPLSYWLGRRLIKVNYVGITNLIAQKELQPELLQDQAHPDTIADKAVAMLQAPQELAALQQELAAVRDLLGGSGAAKRVAAIAWELVDRDAETRQPIPSS